MTHANLVVLLEAIIIWDLHYRRDRRSLLCPYTKLRAEDLLRGIRTARQIERKNNYMYASRYKTIISASGMLVECCMDYTVFSSSVQIFFQDSRGSLLPFLCRH
eukprot:scpid87622/ scgid35430/ 